MKEAGLREWSAIVFVFVLTTLTTHYGLFLMDLVALTADADLHLCEYPVAVHYFQQVRREGFPLWDPANFAGVSHVGTSIISPFNPLNVLALVLSPALTFGIQAAFHSVLRGAGMYFLLRHALKHSTVPALVGGVLYQALPVWSPDYSVHYWAHEAFPVSYYPIATAFVLLHAETKQWRYATYAGLTLALAVLVGTPLMLPPLTLSVLPLCVGALVYHGERGVLRILARSMWVWLWVVGIALGISAVLLVPFVQAYLESTRFAYDQFAYAPPSRFMAAMHGVRVLITAARPNLTGVTVFLPLIGVCSLLAITQGRRSRAMIGCVYPTAGLLAMLWATGMTMPGAWSRLPVLSKFPMEAFGFLIDFLAGLIVAVGVEGWLGGREVKSRAGRTVVAVVRLYLLWIGAFAVSMMVVFAFWPMPRVVPLFHDSATPEGSGAVALTKIFQLRRWLGFYPPSFFGARAWVVFALALSQAGFGWLCLRRRTTSGALRMSVVAIAVTSAAGFSLRITEAVAPLQGRLYAANDISRVVAALPPWARVVYLADRDDYFSNEHQFWHAGPLVHGVALPNGRSHNAPARVMRLLYAAEFDFDLATIAHGRRSPLPKARLWHREDNGGETPDAKVMSHIILTRPDAGTLRIGQLGASVVRYPDPPRLLRLFGARFIIALKPLDLNGIAEAEVALRLPRDNQVAVLYEDPNRLPRAFIASRCLALSPPADLAALRSVDPLRVAIVDTTASLPCMRDVQPTESGGEAASITDYRSSKVVIAVQPTRPAVLVLTDTFSSEWRAYVDGERRPIFPADIAFRGVEVRPGDRQVEFVYQPTSMYVGLGISMGTIVALAGVKAGRRGRIA